MDTRGVVLVVDDEAGVRALIRRILEGAGYGVLEAENGAEALKRLDSGAVFDFLMADLDMPVMRGEEMALRFRVRRPALRILYVTAHIDSLMDGRPLLSDTEAFLEKPFTAAGLLEAVALLKTGQIGNPPPSAPRPRPGVWQFLRQLSGTRRSTASGPAPG
jgi:CheY-like chemotaxis protein